MMGRMKRLSTHLLCVLAMSIAAIGCTGSSPEALRKEAQANADKYLEFLKAGDFEGAYSKTLHSDYKRQMSEDSFVKYRQGFVHTAGALDSYQMVHYDADTERGTVTLNYAVKYTQMAETGSEIVKLRREGTEWRITSIEPKLPQKAPYAPDITMPGYAPPSNQPAPPAPGPK